MNEKAGLDPFLLNGVYDFVEGHYHGFKIRLVKFEGEIGGGLQPRHRDALACKLSWFKRLGGNDDRAIALAETGAAIEQDVLVAEGGVGGKTDGGDVVGFGESSLVQRLDIRQNVGVLVSGRSELMSGEGIKHEGIVGIRGVRQLDLDRFFLGFRGCLLAGHGRVRFLFQCDPGKTGSFHAQPRRDYRALALVLPRETFPRRRGSIRDEREKKCASQGLAWRW